MRYIEDNPKNLEYIIGISKTELDYYLKILNEINNDFSLKFTQRERFNKLLTEFRNIKRDSEQYIDQGNLLYNKGIEGHIISGETNKLNQFEICSYDNKCNEKATKVLTMVDAYNNMKFINPLALCKPHLDKLENEMRMAGMNDIKLFDIDKFKEMLGKQHKDILDEHEY